MFNEKGITSIYSFDLILWFPSALGAISHKCFSLLSSRISYHIVSIISHTNVNANFVL